MNRKISNRCKSIAFCLYGCVLLSGCDSFISSWVKGGGFKSIQDDVSTPPSESTPPIAYKTEKFNSERTTFRVYSGMSSLSSVGNLASTKLNLTEIDPSFLFGTKDGWRTEPTFAGGNVWNSVAGQISKNRFGSQFVQIQNKFYKIGGADESKTRTSEIYSFDMESSTFAIEFKDRQGVADVDFPKPRDNPSVATLNGNIYFFGGLDSAGILRNDLWMFNPTSKVFSLIKGDNNSGVGVVGVDYPIVRESACLIGNGTNELYLVGGRIDPSVTFANDVWVYNTSTNLWALRKGLNNDGVGVAGADFPAAVINKSCAAKGNSIFIYGGYFGSSTNRSSGSSSTANRVFKFDITTSTWTLELASDNGGVGVAGTDFPAATYDQEILIKDDLLYIYRSLSSAEIWTYDVNSKSFSKLKAANNAGVGTAGVDFPKTGESIGATAFWNSNLFIWNGGVYNALENTVWQFKPAAQQFSLVSTTDPTSSILSSADKIVSIKGDEVFYSTQDSAEQGRLIKYNIVTNQFQTIHRGGNSYEPGAPTINYPNFYGSASCMVDDNVYYFGGYLVGSMPYPHYNQVWKYNLVSNTYQLLFAQDNGGTGTAGVDFPRGRASLQIACANNKMYVVAGQSWGSYNNDVWSFDLNTYIWSRLKGANNDSVGSVGVNYPNTLRNTKMIHFEGNLYLFGGQKYPSGFSNELWKFNLTNNTWVRLMAENNGGSGVVNVNYPGSFYSGGSLTGYSSNLYAAVVLSSNSEQFQLWKFDLVTNTWSVIRDSSNNGIGSRTLDFPTAPPSFYIDPSTSKIIGKSSIGNNNALWELNLKAIETNQKRQLLIETKLSTNVKGRAKIKINYSGQGDSIGTIAYGAELYYWQKTTSSFSLLHENNNSVLAATPFTVEFDSDERDIDNKIYFLLMVKNANGVTNKSTLDIDPNSLEILYQD